MSENEKWPRASCPWNPGLTPWAGKMPAPTRAGKMPAPTWAGKMPAPTQDERQWASHRSASSADMQPVPAAEIACR
jgi:hypothetical protein